MKTSKLPSASHLRRGGGVLRASLPAWIHGLLCVLGLAGCQRVVPTATPTRTIVRYVEALAVENAPIQSRAEYIGLVTGDVETDLSFQVGGVLEFIGRAGERADWQEGVTVHKGEVLAQLKQEDFLNAVKAARTQSELATRELERHARLRSENVLSAQEFDASSARKQATETTLERAEQALKDSVVRAPYDGTILVRLANPGETVSPGKVILKIADLRQMSVELGVPDRLVGRIQVGREIPVRISALEARQFPGRVSEVGARARDGARLFRVVIKVPNPAGVLKSGMTASVVLDDSSALPPGAALVPLSALVGSSRGGASNDLAVFVVDASGVARERPVKTDDLVRSSIVVTSGLKPGERVVSVGASSLHDGEVVEARPAEASGLVPPSHP